MSAYVCEPVVRGDHHQPLFSGLFRALRYCCAQPSKVGVDAADGFEILPAQRPAEVPGVVRVAEIDEADVRAELCHCVHRDFRNLGVDSLIAVDPVSYTHLTLPTNREV